MEDIVEAILTFIFILIFIGCFMWIRYLQADKVFACVFDYSPRTCSILYRNMEKK